MKVFILFVFTLMTIGGRAQTTRKVEILHANTIEYNKKSGTEAKKLIGDVQLQHENVIMTCDSAYLYSESNYVDAFSNIHIRQGDTLNLYGDLLNYDGNAKLAKMRKHVRLKTNQFLLTTEYLDYKLADHVAYYFNGGRIINADNTLTSKTGYYYDQEKLLYYRKNVVIKTPSYTIYSDTMKYNTVTRIAYFFGPTNIISKENLIYCENGWYDTRKDISQFNQHAYLKSDKKLLKGDSLYYERRSGIGKAFKNIELVDSARSLTLKGNYARYFEKTEFAMITDSAVLLQYNEKDTLFLHADTLRSVTDTIKKTRTINAFHKVKFFKSDMQGRCDSMTYTTADSTMRLFGTPVLWHDVDQLTSDSVKLLFANQKLKEAQLFSSAFIVSHEDSGYNQIRGKNMTGYFVEDTLRRVLVSGNGQTVYYAKDKDNQIGVNKAESSDLIIFLKNNKIDRIQLLTKPDATLYPLDKAPEEELILKGFKWFEHSRPQNKFDIFKWVNE